MKIIGHRGACGYEPENTLASCQKALDLGVDMIEVDVHALYGGDLVVTHDDKVDRTTNGTGYVADFDLKALQQLDAGQGQKIPLLTEVLDLVDRRVPINIELKSLGTAKLVADVIGTYRRRGWSADLFLVSSFNPDPPTLLNQKRFWYRLSV